MRFAPSREVSPLADTRAYFPSLEEAERFARHFDERRYRIAIQPEARRDRQVYRVHVQRLEPAPRAEEEAATWVPLIRTPSVSSPRGFHDYRPRGPTLPDVPSATPAQPNGGPSAHGNPPAAASAAASGDDLARRTGRSFGLAVAQKEACGPMQRREATARLAALMDACGLGGLDVLCMRPLVVRVTVAHPGAVEDRGARCGHVAGFLEGALGSLLGCGVGVREIDCTSLGNAYCTFAVET